MDDRLRKALDWPQAWAAAGLLIICILGWVGFPGGYGIYGPGLALGCLILGVWLIVSAIQRMQSANTTITPQGAPTELVTDGVFAISRNPIYLGDVLILLAAAFWSNSFLALIVVGGFIWVVTDRFISAEESRLNAAFGDHATGWFARVRRWL